MYPTFEQEEALRHLADAVLRDLKRLKPMPTCLVDLCGKYPVPESVHEALGRFIGSEAKQREATIIMAFLVELASYSDYPAYWRLVRTAAGNRLWHFRNRFLLRRIAGEVFY